MFFSRCSSFFAACKNSPRPEATQRGRPETGGFKQAAKKLEQRLKNINGLIPRAAIATREWDADLSVKDLEAKAEHGRAAVKRMVRNGYLANEPILVSTAGPWPIWKMPWPAASASCAPP